MMSVMGTCGTGISSGEEVAERHIPVACVNMTFGENGRPMTVRQRSANVSEMVSWKRQGVIGHAAV